jgi:hypothetical protein
MDNDEASGQVDPAALAKALHRLAYEQAEEVINQLRTELGLTDEQVLEFRKRTKRKRGARHARITRAWNPKTSSLLDPNPRHSD